MKKTVLTALTAVAVTAPILAAAPAQAAARPSDCHVEVRWSPSSYNSRDYSVTAWCNVIPAGSRIRAKIEWYGIDYTSEWTAVPGRKRTVYKNMYPFEFGRGTYQVGYY